MPKWTWALLYLIILGTAPYGGWKLGYAGAGCCGLLLLIFVGCASLGLVLRLWGILPATLYFVFCILGIESSRSIQLSRADGVTNRDIMNAIIVYTILLSFAIFSYGLGYVLRVKYEKQERLNNLRDDNNLQN